MYSAIKHQGKPLYKLANKGIMIERAPRTVHIRQLTLLAHTADTLTLDVVCSKGTYIRSLVEDIGQALHCGAHVAALHRHYCAPFQQTPMITLEELEAMTLEERRQQILPTDAALQHIPAYPLSDEQAARLLQGQRVKLDTAPEHALEQVRFCSPLFGFIGLGEVSTTGVIHPRRMMEPELIKACNFIQS
jgi:tRNA pseudouridine55 synthase